MKRLTILTLTIVALLLGSGSCFAVVASFQGLGYLHDSSYTNQAFAVSNDGSFVVGYDESWSWGTEAFRWMADGKMDSLGDVPGGYCDAKAYDVTADGSVVVGYGYRYIANLPSMCEAFLWTPDGGMMGLGSCAGYWDSRAYAISADGSVVVGQVFSETNFNPWQSGWQAFRWTATEGMVGLGSLYEPTGAHHSIAFGVSSDGSVIVGESTPYELTNRMEAFRWTADEGMIGLGFLPGSRSSSACDVSDDGSVIVGSCDLPGGKAFRWTAEGGMVGLGHLPGHKYSEPHALSGDGSIVVGHSSSGYGEYIAFLWTPENGMVDIKGFLENEYNLDMTGWTLTSATGISSNGLIIVGNGINPDGYREAWIATIPEPATVLLLGLGATFLRPRPKSRSYQGKKKH